jgi:hypothetical protein
MSGLGTGTVLQPAGGASRPRRPRSSARAALLYVGAVVVGGVALGAIWRVLAPVARTDVVDGGVYLQGHQELWAAQDGWFVIVTGLAGVALATVQSVRARPPLTLHAVVALVGLAGSCVIARWAGTWLGPDALVDQVAQKVQHPWTPVVLHSFAGYLVGPLLFAITRCLAALLGGSTSDHG